MSPFYVSFYARKAGVAGVTSTLGWSCHTCHGSCAQAFFAESLVCDVQCSAWTALKHLPDVLDEQRFWLNPRYACEEADLTDTAERPAP